MWLKSPLDRTVGAFTPYLSGLGSPRARRCLSCLSYSKQLIFLLFLLGIGTYWLSGVPNACVLDCVEPASLLFFQSEHLILHLHLHSNLVHLYLGSLNFLFRFGAAISITSLDWLLQVCLSPDFNLL